MQLRAEKTMLEPLVEIGVATRPRCLEHFRSRQPKFRGSADESLISKGKQAAHAGNILAD